MSEYECYLVEVFYRNSVLECAIKLHKSVMRNCEVNKIAFREEIKKHLPLHVTNAGPVISVREIFEVVVKEKERPIDKIRAAYNGKDF